MQHRNSHNGLALFRKLQAGRLLVLLLMVGLLLLGSCSVFQQAKAYERFAHSRFALQKARLLSIGKVDVSQKTGYSQLNFQQIVTLGMQMLQGDLPAVMEITVEGYNPSQEKAAISGTDWVLLAKNDTLAKGTIDKPLAILPGKRLLFPVKARFNLGKLLTSGSLQQIVNVLLSNNTQAAYQKVDLVFKIRPWYRTGKKVRKSPVFIAIHPKIR
jgi:hypothetical protein